jgi:transposase InsO family protein
VSEKYEFIDAEYAEHRSAHPSAGRGAAPTVTQMCAWLRVSRSGFYEWRSRPTSATAARRELLKTKVRALFDANHATYGYRRLHAALVRDGERVSPELVRRLMRDLGLVACQPRPWRTTTIRDQKAAAAPDLVGRDFTAPAPGTKLVSDLTYIRTWAGWLYLATVIDCCTKEVIGYAMADHMRTDLICDALDMAARNHTLVAGCILHSDRGTQYTSTQFADKLQEHGLRQSLGRTGICYDNALAESFFGALKNELIYRKVYPTRKKARDDIARYIETFYNRRRLHSGLDYKTPTEARIEFLNEQAAA